MFDFLFALVVGIALPARAWVRHRRNAGPTWTAKYVGETVTLTGILVALLWRHGVLMAAIRRVDLTPLRFLRDVAICLAVVEGLDLYSVWRASWQIKTAGPLPELEGLAQDALAGGRNLGAFTTVCVVGAIWEELCFRGTVFLLVPHTPGGLVLGCAGGTVLFGAQHLRNGRSGVLYSSFYGLLFSVLYLSTGDLVAVAIAHAAGNLLAAATWAPRIERMRRNALPPQASAAFLG